VLLSLLTRRSPDGRLLRRIRSFPPRGRKVRVWWCFISFAPGLGWFFFARFPLDPLTLPLLPFGDKSSDGGVFVSLFFLRWQTGPRLFQTRCHPLRHGSGTRPWGRSFISPLWVFSRWCLDRAFFPLALFFSSLYRGVYGVKDPPPCAVARGPSLFFLVFKKRKLISHVSSYNARGGRSGVCRWCFAKSAGVLLFSSSKKIAVAAFRFPLGSSLLDC